MSVLVPTIQRGNIFYLRVKTFAFSGSRSLDSQVKVCGANVVQVVSRGK